MLGALGASEMMDGKTVQGRAPVGSKKERGSAGVEDGGAPLDQLGCQLLRRSLRRWRLPDRQQQRLSAPPPLLQAQANGGQSHARLSGDALEQQQILAREVPWRRVADRENPEGCMAVRQRQRYHTSCRPCIMVAFRAPSAGVVPQRQAAAVAPNQAGRPVLQLP